MANHLRSDLDQFGQEGELPQIKIYSKLPGRRPGNRSVLQEGMEGTHEVNDGRKACIDQKLCPPLPEEGQEGEGGSADGVYPDDGLQPLLWGLSASPPGQADLVEPQSGGAGGCGQERGWAAGPQIRPESCGGAEDHLEDTGLFVWQTSGRHFARSGAHFTKRWGAESGCQHTRAVDPDQRRHHRSAAGAREAQAAAQGAIRDQAGNAAQTPDSD